MVNAKNLAIGTVDTPPSPADSGTTLTLASGDEERFSGISFPFYVSAYPDNEMPTPDNTEILKVTAIDLGTGEFTIEREARGTEAKSIAAGWIIVNSIYTEDINPIEVTVTTARTTAAKVGTTSAGDYVPQTGDVVQVTFTLGISVNTPTLDIDGSGAKNIKIGDVNVSTATLSTAATSTVLRFWYDGTAYQAYGSMLNTNTTYTEITESEISTGTSSTTRTITGRRAAYIISLAQDGRDPSVDGAKLDTIETNADVTDATNVDAAGAVMNSDTSTASMNFVVDEDNMSSNSATKVPTQKSTKAYVDAKSAPLALGGVLGNMEVFSSSGTYTKPAGLKFVVVELVGGGGGAGGAPATTASTNVSSGTAGGGGGYSKKIIDAASIGTTETVTVGSGGTAGTTSTGGGDGGTSSFGSHLQATGGKGGAFTGVTVIGEAQGITSGEAGVGSGGDINMAGYPATQALRLGVRANGGTGGSSYFGAAPDAAAAASSNASQAARAATNPGAGASGGYNTGTRSAIAGAAGAAGLVIVYEYF